MSEMTTPDQIAAEIFPIDPLRPQVGADLRNQVAAALRKYGDLEFKRGQITISPNLRNDVAELVAKADAEGFRRGVEQTKIEFIDAIRQTFGKLKLQRGQEGGE